MGEVILQVELFVESEELSVEDLDRMIGVRCNHSWRKGEPRKFVDKVYDNNLWLKGSKTVVSDKPEDIVDRMNADLRQILRQMEGHEQDFRAVASKAASGLVVAMSCPYVPPLDIKADVLEGIAALGVNLEFDITLSG